MSMQLVLLCVLSVYFSSINGSFISRAWANAQKMTVFEQEVEDVNAVHKIDNHLARRLIVMPLTENSILIKLVRCVIRLSMEINALCPPLWAP